MSKPIYLGGKDLRRLRDVVAAVTVGALMSGLASGADAQSFSACAAAAYRLNFRRRFSAGARFSSAPRCHQTTGIRSYLAGGRCPSSAPAIRRSAARHSASRPYSSARPRSAVAPGVSASIPFLSLRRAPPPSSARLARGSQSLGPRAGVATRAIMQLCFNR